jgi:hypothetical protein
MPILAHCKRSSANDQSDVKRPVSPPAGGAAASAYSVNRPHGANAVRYVNSLPSIITLRLDVGSVMLVFGVLTATSDSADK